ncbi:cytochrome c biogenesis protein ResB [Haloferula sp.]|uniref:cytochrome c biogenesis protein ResB n=1 Tax=Haloferula sp. TaxID=2497595 RepID=UPI00329AB515
MSAFWNNLGQLLSSLRLTVVLLGLSMVLVLIATFAQVEWGIHEVQKLYFRSWIAWVDVIPGEKSFSLPLPGGMLLGSLLMLNLLVAHFRRFQFRWNKTGLILIHLGVLLLLLGELFTALFGKEAQMRLDEGQARNYSEFPREIELALIDMSEEGVDQVTAIPLSRLKDGAEFELDGFKLTIRRFFQNSEILPEASASDDFDPMRATQGLATEFAVLGTPRETAMDRRDLGSAFVELIDSGGESKGVWLLSNALKAEQSFKIGDKPWKMAIRQCRLYHPFSLRLLDFTHEKYLGTEIPKNFSSRVTILNEEKDEERETLIYMNHPLRYEGLTFFQSGFDNDDTTSILQVVKNPVWTLPYIACTLVAVGLLWVFSQHLFKAVAKRRRKP